MFHPEPVKSTLNDVELKILFAINFDTNLPLAPCALDIFLTVPIYLYTYYSLGGVRDRVFDAPQDVYGENFITKQPDLYYHALYFLDSKMTSRL